MCVCIFVRSLLCSVHSVERQRRETLLYTRLLTWYEYKLVVCRRARRIAYCESAGVDFSSRQSCDSKGTEKMRNKVERKLYTQSSLSCNAVYVSSVVVIYFVFMSESVAAVSIVGLIKLCAKTLSPQLWKKIWQSFIDMDPLGATQNIRFHSWNHG